MIPAKLRKQVMERSGGVCEGEYTRISGSEVVRTGNCGREGTAACHIKHSGMGHSKSRDTADNLLWLCSTHHDFMDERLTPKAYNRIRCGL